MDTIKAAAAKVLDPSLNPDDYTCLAIILAATCFLALTVWLMKTSYKAAA